MPHENTALGSHRHTVVLCEHRADWAACYSSEAALIRKVMGNDLTAAAHVGSTAIPGIVAKPIIDILVAVPALDFAEKYTSVLATAGYERRVNADGPDNRFFAKGPYSLRTFHLTMTLAGSQFWQRTLSFRDYLTKHEVVARRYETLKCRLAGLYPNDRPSYTAGKSAFVAEVLALAAASRSEA